MLSGLYAGWATKIQGKGEKIMAYDIGRRGCDGGEMAGMDAEFSGVLDGRAGYNKVE